MSALWTLSCLGCRTTSYILEYKFPSPVVAVGKPYPRASLLKAFLRHFRISLDSSENESDTKFNYITFGNRTMIDAFDLLLCVKEIQEYCTICTVCVFCLKTCFTSIISCAGFCHFVPVLSLSSEAYRCDSFASNCCTSLDSRSFAWHTQAALRSLVL